jgi:hypothetical protein
VGSEFKDTLDYLLDRLKGWGFHVGCTHGGMKSGLRAGFQLRRDYYAATHERRQNGWLRRGGLLCPFLCPAPSSTGAESGDLGCQKLTGKAANYKDSHIGEVAEWLKAAVC